MSLIKGPAQNLADYMIKLSLKHHNTEWAMGLEFELWNEMLGDQDILSSAEINELKELSKWCGGWITMTFVSGKETLEFMLLDDWKIKFKNENPL